SNPGIGAQSTGGSSLAIGSADGTNAGAIANAESAMAIGPAFAGVANGAVAGGLRSVAIGTGASVSQNDAIVLGNVNTNAVSVGIGTNTPSAKLTVSGTGFGGVTPLQLIGLSSIPTATTTGGFSTLVTSTVSGPGNTFSFLTGVAEYIDPSGDGAAAGQLFNFNRNPIFNNLGIVATANSGPGATGTTFSLTAPGVYALDYGI